MNKKNLKKSLSLKVRPEGPGIKAKKLGDEHDDKWEAEETAKGYWTPDADDTTGYDAKSDDNADDDFKHGGWTKETKARAYKNEKKSKKAKKQIGDNTKMNYKNAYVRSLMEEEPSKEELEKIKKKPVKIRKAHYYGGKTDPKKVDVPAAIADLKKGIKGAGQAAVKKNQDEREAEERKDEAIGAVVAGAGRVLGGLVKGGTKLFKSGVKGAAKVGKKVGREAVQAGAEGVATAVSDEARKRDELKQQQASSKTLNAGTEYTSAYVRALMEMCRTCDVEGIEAGKKKAKEGGTQGEQIKAAMKTRREARTRRHGKGKTGEEGRMAPATFPGGAENPPQHAHSDPSQPSELGKKMNPPRKRTTKKKGMRDHTEYYRIGRILYEVAGRKLSPVQKRYKGTSASEVAASKTVDTGVQADVAAEAARTKAKVPGANPDAGHLLAQKKARDAEAKAKGKKPTGDQRGHGTSKPGLGATTPRRP